MTNPPESRQITVPARMPVPGNAEFLLLVILDVLIAILAAASDRVDAHDWMWATTWLGAAYLISRGIAKASRVLEH